MRWRLPEQIGHHHQGRAALSEIVTQGQREGLETPVPGFFRPVLEQEVVVEFPAPLGKPEGGRDANPRANDFGGPFRGNEIRAQEVEGAGKDVKSHG